MPVIKDLVPDLTHAALLLGGGLSMDDHDMRFPLARAIGLGSAKAGVVHWWAQRVSAIALIPLTLWFVASLIAHTHSYHAAFLAWSGAPLTAVATILLPLALFHHTALGLQVITEDYMHSRAKCAVVVAMRLTCLALTIAGAMATLHMAFTG